MGTTAGGMQGRKRRPQEKWRRVPHRKGHLYAIVILRSNHEKFSRSVVLARAPDYYVASQLETRAAVIDAWDRKSARGKRTLGP